MCYVMEWLNPSILSAVSAFFSCIATFGLLYIAYKTYNFTKKADEIKYASKVAIWTNSVEFQNDSNFVNTVIVNLSESPIYDVYIIGCQYVPNKFKHIKSFEDFEHRDTIYSNFDQSKKTFIDVKVIGDRKSIEGFKDLMTVSIFFRDVNNKEWCRDSNGILYKCPNYGDFFTKKHK